MPLTAALSRSACAIGFLRRASCPKRHAMSCRSVGADIPGANHLAPTVELAADQRGVGFGGHRAGPDTDLGELLLHLGALQSGADLRLPMLGELGWKAGRRRKAEPVGRHDIGKSRLADS